MASEDDLNDFYLQNGLDPQIVEEELFKKDIFDDIMEKFNTGVLTFKGKGGVKCKVTNPKQAYAIACSISERQWKKMNKPKTNSPS